MTANNTKSRNPLFGRILTAMVTPFKENGEVDYELATVSYTHLTLPTKRIV